MKGGKKVLKLNNVYSRQELVEMFHTDRLDSIKRSLTRQGYEFEMLKNGKNAQMKIIKAPNMFKVFCIEELGISAQSDFHMLRNFFYYFFCDDEFQQLPVAEMERVLAADGRAISYKTIAKWISYLEEKGIIYRSITEYVYYCSISGKAVEITKEEYLKAWEVFRNTLKNTRDWNEARKKMIEVNGGAVHKTPLVQENDFYGELINSLADLVMKGE